MALFARRSYLFHFQVTMMFVEHPLWILLALQSNCQILLWKL